MSIDSTWLRCPNCFSDLSPVDERVYGCEHGHRFDRSRYGYLTLLPPKAPRTIGDDREMLAARAGLLAGGAYRPIAEALLQAAIAGRASSPRELRLADLGCGTGYYAAHLAAALPESAVLLADRSPDAVRTALRAVPGSTGIVLDLWRALPLRDGSADVILNVFAPRNAAEFARILRSDGRLLVVVPRAEHLHELRADGRLLDVPPEKANTVTEQLATAGLQREEAAHVEYVLRADRATRALLAGMGPSAHHAATLAGEGETEAPIEVTVSVDVLTFAHAPTEG